MTGAISPHDISVIGEGGKRGVKGESGPGWMRGAQQIGITRLTESARISPNQMNAAMPSHAPGVTAASSRTIDASMSP